MLTKLSEKLLAILPVKYQQLGRQFLKFAVTGGLGAIVDFGSYNILSRLLGWTTIYYVFGYEVIAANLVSVPLAITSNFILNKYWTFRDKESNVARQWTSYFVLNFFTFILNQIVTSFFAFRVPIIETLFGTQKDNIAKALAIGIILFVNFIGSKLFIFRSKTKPTPATTRIA